MKVAIFFHYPCSDGIMSATIAGLGLKRQVENLDIRYIPINYPQQFDTVSNFVEKEHCEHYYFVDFCPSFETFAIFSALGTSHRVTVIDHHHTALDQQEKIVAHCTENNYSLPRFYLFTDTNESGALLTYNYFFGFENTEYSGSIGYYARLTSIRDCWVKPPSVTAEKKLESDIWSNLVVNIRNRFVKIPDIISYLERVLIMEESVSEEWKEAEILLKDYKKRCFITAKQASFMPLWEFNDYCNIENDNNANDYVAFINCSPDVASSACEYIYDNENINCPAVVTYRHTMIDGVMKVALSSRSRRGFNIEPYMRSFGGGGHQQAAGAVIDHNLLNTMLDKLIGGDKIFPDWQNQLKEI